ncbi:hypothetical protein RRF57_012123 [Xylaria bambusicola]|uniref:BTB domain-containing protein n=1 Tax=Xylaria bambusicola TaxID=326684 RepID=A0AAN7ZDG5_9PEZI
MKMVNHSSRFLESGMFSDVTVKCGDKTWNLHRNILSTRCQFFRKELQANTFKESTEQLIELHDAGPDEVFWAIYYIYTTRLPEDFMTLVENSPSAITRLIDLFNVADFFTLDALCDHTCHILRDILHEHAMKIYEFLKKEKGRNSQEEDGPDFQSYDDKPERAVKRVKLHRQPEYATAPTSRSLLNTPGGPSRTFKHYLDEY